MHHKVELDIIRTLSALKSPKNVAVGLECFYRQHQGALDRYDPYHQAKHISLNDLLVRCL